MGRVTNLYTVTIKYTGYQHVNRCCYGLHKTFNIRKIANVKDFWQTNQIHSHIVNLKEGNMNISKTIKEQRNQLSLSQEKLAEKLYVTRQTIGNWENDKSYPDIHSLVLLSQIFDMTIDNLVKGDLEMMKKTIERNDVGKTKRNAWLCGCIGIFVILSSFNISTHLFSTPFIIIPSIITSTLLFVGAFYFGIKSGLINRNNAIECLTYREIIRFTNGDTLDEIAKTRVEEKWNPIILFVIIMTGFILILTHGIIWFSSVL